VKGKDGSKQFNGRNFKVKKEENVVISFYSEEDKPEPLKMPYILKLQSQDPITLQNIYKCLCKYFLSVIDSTYLVDFQETIDWINGKAKIEKLPKIGEMTSYNFFTLQPKIVTYIRKDEDTKLPFAVGEFHFTCKLFAFIIPLSGKDDRDFTDKIDFENYWQTFKNYNKSEGWTFMDYSNNKAKEFIMNLSFNLRDNPNDTIMDEK
jgi:hypothetical protein